MQTNWAEENLQVIRTLMERAAIYRHALAPIMVRTGALGAAIATIGWYLKFNSPRQFVTCWCSAAVVAVYYAFLLARRQALRNKEPFWSGPTRRVAQALLPALFVGLVAGIVSVYQDPRREAIHPLLPVLWIGLYGCAVHAAGFFMPRGIKWLGWTFIVGACLLAFPLVLRAGNTPLWLPHVFMGLFFGALQLGYGLILTITEKQHRGT
jgi:hypothetical protein